MTLDTFLTIVSFAVMALSCVGSKIAWKCKRVSNRRKLYVRVGNQAHRVGGVRHG